MRLIGNETCPLPEDPALAEVAAALNEVGAWIIIVDREWRWVYSTDDNRLTQDAGGELAPIPLGSHFYGTESLDTMLAWRSGGWRLDAFRAGFTATGPWLLSDTPGGREELRDLVDPKLRDLVDEISATADQSTAFSFTLPFEMLGRRAPEELPFTLIRVRDETGRLAGTVIHTKPPVGMHVLGAMASMGDLGHFARMLSVAKAGRRPAAILFADLEASSPLAKRLSTASYFALGRRLVRAADQCVIDAGGLVGRHVGDGVVAFFLAETAGSESAAARNCVTAARALREALDEVATRSDLQPEDVVLRFGLHWGSTLYVGNILSRGRSEVTALGDEVNDGARIEACASGGLALASKDLIERLEPEDATALDLDPDRITYMPLAELSTATEKARRDAPAIAVCEI